MFVHDMRTYKLSSQVFTIFDDNGDELLSNREFISVLKERAHRGLEKVHYVTIIHFVLSESHCILNKLV